MKSARSFLVFMLLVFLGNVVASGKADTKSVKLPSQNQLITPSEVEPNNTSFEANDIELNSSISGEINNIDDNYDFYRFTIPNDGKITFIIVPGAALDAYLDLYDQDGESFLHYSMQAGVGITDTLVYPNLKAGTYYVRVGGGGEGTYTLNNVFTPTAIPDGNDAEPNDTPAESVFTDYNIPFTGHLGFLGNGATDLTDFFSFTIPFDGKMTFTLIPENTLDCNIDLYDQDGASFLASSNQTGVGINDTLIYGNLKAGTYFFRIGGGGYGSYTLNNVFTATSIPKGNDVEPNDVQAESFQIGIDVPTTGHLGFLGNGATDLTDFFSFTIPFDGKMTFTLIPENTLDGYIDLYDQDGASFLMSSMQTGVGVNDTLNYGNLKAGTYYIRIGGGGYGSYTLNNVFTATSIPNGNDVEPNDIQTESLPIGLDGSNTGHLGYFGNQMADYYDFYSFTTPVDGKILFTLVQDNTIDAYMDLLDQDGINFLRVSSETGLGVTDSLVFSNLKAGTYFIRIGGGGYGSYSLNNYFTPTAIPNGNDAEPNETYAEANSLNINNSKTGHINYFGNGTLDYYDFYTFSISAKGKITAILTPENTLDAYIDLYDQNGTTFLRFSTQTGTGIADTLIYEDLNAGSYFIGIGGSGYGSYTLNLSFTENVVSVENPIKNQVTIVPNFNNKIISINNIPASDVTSIEIIDVSGRIILRERLFNTNNQINFSGKRGLFLVKVSSGKTKVVRKVVF